MKNEIQQENLYLRDKKGKGGSKFDRLASIDFSALHKRRLAPTEHAYKYIL